MPIVWDAGNVNSSPGNVQPSYSNPGVTSAIIREQTPFIEVRANGTLIPGVVGATIVHGLDLPYATATVDLAPDSAIPNAATAIPQNAEIRIVVGAGTFNQLRFVGFYKRQRVTMWPYTFSLVCRGRYGLAHEYQQSEGVTIPTFVNQKLPVTGINIFQLLNGAEPTDQNIVLAVLNRVPSLNVDPADIGGTGRHFGLLAWRDMSWTPFQTAGAYIQQLDRVCLGFRTFESLGGRVMRRQIRGYPNGSADTQFTEGVDVWEATGDRSIEELINAVYVEGYPVGGNPGIINSYLPSTNPIQGDAGDNPHIEQFNSPLIEGIDTGDPGSLEWPALIQGLTPHEVALWRMDEGNRQLVNVDLLTFRDDILFPSRTIAVYIPHIGITEPVWIQRVEIRIQAEPVLFTQRILGLGGGLADAPSGPPDPY
jgi:hypothetical protein